MEHLRREAFVKIYDPDLAKADETATNQAADKKAS
jgi:hypothetical protein